MRWLFGLLRRWRRRTRYESGGCPRQAHGTMSAQLDHVCVWYDDTWSPLRQIEDRLRTKRTEFWDKLEKDGWWTPKRRDRFLGGTYWPGGTKPPRTCSYCGGAHPDDVIRLLMEGWEVESTGKSYKRYLHPPGYAAAIESARDSGFSRWEGPRSPIPPVKVYVYHFDQRQVDAFNAALDAARHGFGIGVGAERIRSKIGRYLPKP